VTNGGVLLAVPALSACGLLRHTDKYFQLPPGYYGLKSIFLLLAFMALSRLKSVEQLRYCAPGEWGKLLGLDRVPEVRTLRAKIAHLVAQEQATAWSAELSQDWMQELPPQTAVFCVDGHVRVYHGEQTQLPRHHVARQKLCLRATTDYWVNALDGRPFFLINKAVDPGLLKVLEDELEGELEGQKLERYEQKKATLLEAIQRLQAEVDESKAQRKAAPRHIPISELPEEARFQRLSVEGKHILDTIKMIAYRAETTLVQMARERLARPDDARQLVASLFQTDADFHPDESSGTLTVRLHHSANHSHDEVIRHLCAELNATEATFPETNLRLIYELGAE